MNNNFFFELSDCNYSVEAWNWFTVSSFSDMKFQHEISWSRIYEYPWVLNELENEFSAGKDPFVHNSSWGFEDIHLVFKTWIDALFPLSIHSDVRPSTFHKTYVWDITQRPPDEIVNKFDAVLNISTLEHVPFDHLKILENHLKQLKRGGIFLGTFDVPGLQIKNFENLFGLQIPNSNDDRLTPRNSKIPDKILGLPENFNVCYLKIRRI